MNNINTMTDHELVTLYENGNDNAFDILLARHQEYVYSYILFLVRKREDADDIFQEVFLKLVMNWVLRMYWFMRFQLKIGLDQKKKLIF